APYEETKSFINGLNVPVTVVQRSGISVTIPPINAHITRQFVIKCRYAFSREVFVDVSKLSSDTSKEASILREAATSGSIRYQRGLCIAEINYAVDKEDINSRGGSLYLANVDVVVSTLQTHYVPFHPYSEAGIRHRLV